MRKIWIAFLMMVPCLFAQGSEKNYKEVGGAVLTNFLPTPEQGTKGTTLGTATGDLRGGLGVRRAQHQSRTERHHGLPRPAPLGNRGRRHDISQRRRTDNVSPQYQWLSCIEIYR